MREAFDIRKSFPGVPNVSYARWVGTIKHSIMAEGVKREALVLWLDGCNCVSEKKYGAQKTKKNPDVTSEQLEDVVNQNFGFISFGHE